MPVGTYYEDISDKIDYIQLQPTFIITKQLINKLDLLFSTVMVISKYKGNDISTFFAQNMGMDLRLGKNGFSLHPEVGCRIGEDGIRLYQYSIGISFAPSGYAN